MEGRLRSLKDQSQPAPNMLEYQQTRREFRLDVPELFNRGGLVCLNSAARFDKWNRAAVR